MKRKVKRTLMMKFFDIGMKLSRYYCQKCTSVVRTHIEESRDKFIIFESKVQYI